MPVPRSFSLLRTPTFDAFFWNRGIEVAPGQHAFGPQHGWLRETCENDFGCRVLSMKLVILVNPFWKHLNPSLSFGSMRPSGMPWDAMMACSMTSSTRKGVRPTRRLQTRDPVITNPIAWHITKALEAINCPVKRGYSVCCNCHA